METLIGLLALLLCVVVPLALVIAGVVWMVRKISHSSAASTPASSLDGASFDQLDGLVMRWVAQGRIASDSQPSCVG